MISTPDCSRRVLVTKLLGTTILAELAFMSSDRRWLFFITWGHRDSAVSTMDSNRDWRAYRWEVDEFMCMLSRNNLLIFFFAVWTLWLWCFCLNPNKFERFRALSVSHSVFYVWNRTETNVVSRWSTQSHNHCYHGCTCLHCLPCKWVSKGTAYIGQMNFNVFTELTIHSTLL